MSKIQHITTGNVEIFLFSELDNLSERRYCASQTQIMKEIQDAHSPSRKAELYALDMIWFKHFEGTIFQRKETGKPFCDKYELSISHHAPYLSVARSDRPVGVDIEAPREQLHRIRKKFLHKNEYSFENDLKALQLVWSVKEVVYKIYDDDQMFFWRDIEVLDLNTEANQLKAKVIHQDKTTVHNFEVVELKDGIKIVYSV